MRLRALLCTVLTALLVTAAAATAATAAPPTSANSVSTPVTGTFTDALGGTGTFSGVYELTGFTVQNGQVAAVGTFTGTLTDSVGNVVGVVSQTLTSLVTVTGTCTILDLTIGPIDLNLLGLVVHTDTIHIDIDAQSGPGNLLGNLLCAVAHLLDGGAAATALANLLNAILGAVG